MCDFCHDNFCLKLMSTCPIPQLYLQISYEKFHRVTYITTETNVTFDIIFKGNGYQPSWMEIVLQDVFIADSIWRLILFFGRILKVV